VSRTVSTVPGTLSIVIPERAARPYPGSGSHRAREGSPIPALRACGTAAGMTMEKAE